MSWICRSQLEFPHREAFLAVKTPNDYYETHKKVELENSEGKNRGGNIGSLITTTEEATIWQIVEAQSAL